MITFYYNVTMSYDTFWNWNSDVQGVRETGEKKFFVFFSPIRPPDIGQGASCRQEAGCGASEIFRMGVHLCLVYPDTWPV